MFRRIALVLVVVLLCSCSSAAVTPTVTPQPTALIMATLPPVGATILPSDIGTRQPTGATQDATPSGTEAPPALPPATDTALAATPNAALRAKFKQDINSVPGMSRYIMNWQLSSDLTQLDGRQTVTYTNRTGAPLNEIYFRLFANYPGESGKINITGITVDGAPVTTELSAQDTAMRVPLATALAPNAKTTINLTYTVNIPAKSPVRYSDFVTDNWITTLPTIYPIIPAYDAAGWHTEVPPPFGDLVYADSSLYDVTITAPSGYQVIASGTTVQKTEQGDQTVWHIIGAPMRDFDANLSNTLQAASAQVGDITVNSWFQPQHAQQGKQALKWTTDAINSFQTHFGPYPFRELDLVESPTTAGGIEYPGLITVASSLYSDPGQENFFEFATVHETAHQWFYSLIGDDQVNHPWLDEAAAQYATILYMEDQYGQAEAENVVNMYLRQPYQKGKAQWGDKSAGLPVSAYTEDEYGVFVYDKGPLFFIDVRQALGDDAFFHALQQYYQNFRYKVAMPQDLLKVFNDSGTDVTPIFDKYFGS